MADQTLYFQRSRHALASTRTSHELPVDNGYTGNERVNNDQINNNSMQQAYQTHKMQHMSASQVTTQTTHARAGTSVGTQPHYYHQVEHAKQHRFGFCNNGKHMYFVYFRTASVIVSDTGERLCPLTDEDRRSLEKLPWYCGDLNR
jgi:hypothetical protein